MIELVLPRSVKSVEAVADAPDEPIFPGEEALVANAVTGRRREFVTARRCAREALGYLGYPPAPIGTGPQREPLWPTGVVGSITHCTGYRAAAVALARDVRGVGIDAEPNALLPRGVVKLVASAAEQVMVARLATANPMISWDRLLFSAKESIFKAWYPLTLSWLDFTDALLTFDPQTRSFQARLRRDLPSNGALTPRNFQGHFLAVDGILLTAVVVARGQQGV